MYQARHDKGLHTTRGILKKPRGLINSSRGNKSGGDDTNKNNIDTQKIQRNKLGNSQRDERGFQPKRKRKVQQSITPPRCITSLLAPPSEKPPRSPRQTT